MATGALDDLLLDPGFAEIPYPAYERLRDEAPVFWSEAWGCWVVSRFDDAQSILKQPNRFSNVDRITTLLSHLPPEQRERFALLEQHFASGMVHSDPPDHSRLRKLAAHAFTPRMVAELEPRIQAVVDDLLDAVAPSGRIELIGDLAYPLPVAVIADMLGVPASDRELFKEWSSTTGAFQASGQPEVEALELAQASLEAQRAYLREQLARRRAEPTDDLLSGFIAAEDGGDYLHEDEILSICSTLLSAGHETTTSLIGNGVLALLQHPDQLRLLRDRPELMEGAVEEMLRWDPALQRTWRRIAEDTTFEGYDMRTGQLVVVLLGAANRDPERYPDPDRFDISRSGVRHVGWGHGVHFCLGAPLARLETRIAIATLLDRAPDLRLATDEVRWVSQGVFRCLEQLPLEV